MDDDQGQQPETGAGTEYATSTLLRAGRAAYAGAVLAQLHQAGIDDLPRNGAAILAGIAASTGIAASAGAASAGPRPDLPGDLGVTKQAVSQVIDTLVGRGYVVRGPDPDDRRRISLGLTERGQTAVEAVRRGVTAVDQQLTDRIGAEQVASMRGALRALAEISMGGHPAVAGRRRANRDLRRFCPIFPVRDLKAALAHYAALGFRTEPYEDGDFYGFANREGTGLHLQQGTDHGDHAAAYLYVRDADALYQEWSQPGIGGQTSHVHTTDYGMREGSHTDPDGNVIRFGSDLEPPAETDTPN
jgi:DNA-binding MarR family transcriptional regulator/catechol 2,3-dioxygenase-like lactoylglutathione lyase family enzyme